MPRAYYNLFQDGLCRQVEFTDQACLTPEKSSTIDDVWLAGSSIELHAIIAKSLDFSAMRTIRKMAGNHPSMVVAVRCVAWSARNFFRLELLC
jgi:hypothetical protein